MAQETPADILANLCKRFLSHPATLFGDYEITFYGADLKPD